MDRNGATKISGADSDFHRHELSAWIHNDDLPEWELGVQLNNNKTACRLASPPMRWPLSKQPAHCATDRASSMLNSPPRVDLLSVPVHKPDRDRHTDVLLSTKRLLEGQIIADRGGCHTAFPHGMADLIQAQDHISSCV